MPISPNSLCAYFGVLPKISRRQKEVLQAIVELQACSDREIAAHLGWEINRITNRRGELLKKNLIKRIDGAFRNEYGNPIDKWSPNPQYQQEKLPITRKRYFLENGQEIINGRVS